ncbi:MAG TPA: SPOR domain-containing protein [Burkholderiales bacterium]|nr:SPOR domain-containing protein [Burkholderiales bacterium]
MRALFLLLVLANLAFLAWSRHDVADPPVDPNPLARQVDPEKLKIVPPSELRAPPAPKPSTAAAATAAPPGRCLEWGSFALADYPRAEKALEPLALGSRLVARRTEELAAWWVYMPPQGSRQAALRKSGELKALGVDDYYIVGDDSEWRWALSLGVYRTEEAAQARLEALRAQGVRTAIVVPRDTLVPKVWLQVKNVDPALEARLMDIARQVEGSELRNCP